jgi:hypothetical protein
MALQNILIPFVSLFKSAGLKQAQNALGGLSRQYDSLGKTIGAAVGAMAGFNALQTAQQFVVQSVDATQKFERNLLALNQVFEQAAPQIKNFSKEVENYGLSQQQAAQASVFLGSVLKQYGFTTKESADQTENLVRLAQDLATTYGYDVQESLLAITALFRGEYDPIEKFGVAMKQNEINAELAARGLGDLTGAAEMQAAAQIRLELLFERAGDSMGAFTRASDTLYGSQQRLNAAVGNLQVAFGAPLQGPLADINNIFADIVQDSGANLVMIAESLGEGIENVAPAIELVLTSFANLSIALVPVIETLNTIIGIFTSIIELSNDVAAAILRATKLPDETVVAARKVVIETQAEVDRLTEKQEDLNKAIESGYTAYGTYETQIENIERQIQETITGTTDANTESRRDMARASRFAADAAYAAQQDIEKLSAANDAYTRSWTKRAVFEAQQMGTTFFELRRKALGLDEGKSSGKNFVEDFFDGITDNVKKESSRIKLEAMGASEGLIEAILGAGGWEQVYNKVIKGGIDGLKELQKEFSQTAAGIDELTEAIREAEKAQEALREAIEGAVNEQLEGLKKAAATAQQTYDGVKAAADDFRRWSLENITTIQVLPDVEKELGSFESAVVSTIASMQSELQSAVRSGLIQDSDFNTLRNWVATETTELANLARSRDDLAERYSLSEALISEYQKALTGSLKLTSLFSKLKDETEEITVTETSQGIMKLGASLREFEVTVARSYEKTIDKVQDKTVGLLQGFRDMADKARGFAENLRKLRDMHLDPMLFNELVEAGVEAGGETAQALVDGGDETILEINSLFAEINRLGADLGMDVGQTMYEAGQDLTFGLLEGIQSEQEALYDEMVALAKGLSETFRNNLDIAVEVPVAAAQAALDTATEAVEQAKQVNVGALVQIENIIRSGLKALAGPLSAEFRQGITEKVAGLGALYRDVFSGAVTDIPGITGGMTSADLRAAAMATGGPNVTQYYNITVSGGNRLQQQQTVEEIRKFVDQNGNLSSWVSV